MSLWYKFFYQVGFTPWEEDPNGPAAEQISILFDREEQERELSERRALDVGCGSGIWSVILASRGWEVTGIDIVPKAIRTARARASAAGLNVRFIEGDVTVLRSLQIDPGVRFILDIECFNHLNEAQRAAAGQQITSVASPDASMLMLVWTPGRRGPLPRGASAREIEAAFPGWEIVAEESYAAADSLPGWAKNIKPRFYRLRRATAN